MCRRGRREGVGLNLIVVGAGSTARALLRRLGERWEVTLVDRDPDRVRQAGAIRPVETIIGDGADPDVLRTAGLSEAAAVVATTDDDAVNLSVCRAAAEAGVAASALAADPERLVDYRRMGVPAISPDRLAARRIVSELEPRRVFSAGIAAGLAEGLDFRIVSDSPMRGKALRELASERWLVVSVLREERLIVPHGGTVLEAGDLVTVVGSGEDYAEIVAAFTAGVARFPSDFGQSIGMALEGEEDLFGPVAEAAVLAQATTAETITVFVRGVGADDPEGAARMSELLGRAAEIANEVPIRTHRVAAAPRDALLGGSRDEAVGVVVVPARHRGKPLGRRSVSALCRAARRLDRPILFSRGSHPYERIVVSAPDSPTGWAAGRAAIDIGSQSGVPLTAVVVVPPPYIAGDEEDEAADRSVARLQEEAAVQGVTVRRAVVRGNEVRGLERFITPSTLLVLGVPRRIPSTLAPGIAGHLVRRAHCSVLLVPNTR